MNLIQPEGRLPGLDGAVNEQLRRKALQERCLEYRTRLQPRDPYELARQAALGISKREDGTLALCGESWEETYEISWPDLAVTGQGGKQAPLRTEALWLHYLDRADGHSLSGRWVNLSEIGGLFYQQAFQGYTGDELARAWGGAEEALGQKCRAEGGWAIRGLGDLAFEWRALPRLPVCLCYRRPTESSPAWATMLFDASAEHYVAADVAAILGKQLADRLMPIGSNP